MCVMEENGVCKFADDISDIKKSVEKISTALLGNEYSEGVGLIAKFNLLRGRVEKIEQRLWWLSGVSAAVGAIIAVVIQILF